VPHQLIASPYPEGHLVVRPGYDGAVRIGAARYAELRDAPPDATLPSWLAEAARAGWGIDLAGRPTAGTILVRPETGYGYARASYEVNLGCNYDCEHCYLGEKAFAGMDWPGRERLLQVMADAGVLWLQLTGGEPLIDPLFAETHAAAWDMGMMIQISSNGYAGSRLPPTRCSPGTAAAPAAPSRRRAGPACRLPASTGRRRPRSKSSASTEGGETPRRRPRKEVKRS